MSPNDSVYRLVRHEYKPLIGWTDMPCGKCPVEAFCSEAAKPMGSHHSGRSSRLGLLPKSEAGGPDVSPKISG